MPNLRAQVEAALDSYPPETAVIVADAGGRLLAARDVPNSTAAVLVVIGVGPEDVPCRAR